MWSTQINRGEPELSLLDHIFAAEPVRYAQDLVDDKLRFLQEKLLEGLQVLICQSIEVGSRDKIDIHSHVRQLDEICRKIHAK